MSDSAWRWLVDGALWDCWGFFGVAWAAGAIYNGRMLRPCEPGWERQTSG